MYAYKRICKVTTDLVINLWLEDNQHRSYSNLFCREYSLVCPSNRSFLKCLSWESLPILIRPHSRVWVHILPNFFSYKKKQTAKTTHSFKMLGIQAFIMNICVGSYQKRNIVCHTILLKSEHWLLGLGGGVWCIFKKLNGW